MKEAFWQGFQAEPGSDAVVADVRVLYLCVPLIVAALFISAALALVGDLGLGGVVFWR